MKQKWKQKRGRVQNKKKKQRLKSKRIIPNHLNIKKNTGQLEPYVGEWVIEEYLGHTFIYSNEADEDEIVGQTFIISKDGIDCWKGSIQSPVFDISEIDSSVLGKRRISPDTLGLDEDGVYKEVIVKDESDNGTFGFQFIVKDENTLIYEDVAKYFLAGRKQ